MIPHERSLVEKYKDQSFTILGVNTDTDKADYKRQAVEQKVTWRSAWTGGTSNAISRAFRVTGYPTVFLIDGKGVIRKKWVGAPSAKQLETLIDELLAELPKK
ncbi:MAG: redoxin domain-containing protein [Planctomycetes bacterium]|nr:redoxin domain-containing protein [Planctomycetota bacterium]